MTTEDTQNSSSKRKELSLKEKLQLEEESFKEFEKKYQKRRKHLQESRKKVFEDDRKKRTHYIIEIGAFVLSKTEKAGISGKEETLKKLEELLAPLSQA